MRAQRLILASASPQRKALLEGLGVAFAVQPSPADESACTEREPVARARVLARLKAAAVSELHPRSWVLGGDTLVVAADGTLLEKPANAEDARRMITLQSGSASTVHSTLCLCCPGGEYIEGISSSTVHFAQLSAETVDWWVGTGQWRDRSGAFQIDGRGQLLICHVEGDWSGVVGLPVFLFGELAAKAGLNLFG